MTGTSQLLRQACAHHPERESVGLCPECRHTYCRECLTEYEGRVICADCLAKERAPEKKSSGFLGWCVKSVLGCAVGVLLVFSFYYSLGWSLLKIPEQFHEGRWYVFDE